MSLPLNQVILGDCVEVMDEWPENSVDCIVTDPNYGIGFMGLDWDKALPPRGAFEQMIRVLKPGALAFVMSSPRQDVLWRMLSMLEGVGFELNQSFIEWIYKTGFPKAYDVSKGIDKKLGNDRKIIGRSPHYSSGRKRSWGDGIKYSTQKGTDEETDWVSKPGSELAQKWEGWKSQTGLKPAHEPILMVNKPFSESTIVDNVLRWGTGAINVDACRIPFQTKGEDARLIKDDWKNTQGMSDIKERGVYGKFGNEKFIPHSSPKGRFPANLLVSDKAIDEIGSHDKGGGHFPKNSGKERNVYGDFKGLEYNERWLDEGGGPSRYFDLDAWSEHHGFLDVAKPSRKERDFGLSQFSEETRKWRTKKYKGFVASPRLNGSTREDIKYRNKHPTVKPLKLMAYLIELGCPPDGVVVDPFVGSGTTCVVAKRLRRKWIGIEINPEYVDIARARIDIKGPLDQFLEVDE